MERREPVVLNRSCDATQIPSGYLVTFAEGTVVVPQHVSDGNVTVMLPSCTCCGTTTVPSGNVSR